MKTSKIDLDKLLKQNQLVNREQVAESLKTIRELEKLGVREHTFNVELPFSGKPSVGRVDRDDPRQMTLRT